MNKDELTKGAKQLTKLLRDRQTSRQSEDNIII